MYDNNFLNFTWLFLTNQFRICVRHHWLFTGERESNQKRIQEIDNEGDGRRGARAARGSVSMLSRKCWNLDPGYAPLGRPLNRQIIGDHLCGPNIPWKYLWKANKESHNLIRQRNKQMNKGNNKKANKNNKETSKY